MTFKTFLLIASATIFFPGDGRAFEALERAEISFNGEINTKAHMPYQKGIELLNTRYLAALEQSLKAAASRGDLDATLALKSEITRTHQYNTIPTNDPTQTHSTVVKLRSVWRTEIGQLDKARQLRVSEIAKVYETSLQRMEVEMTRDLNIKAAQEVRQRREALKLLVDAAESNLTVPKANLVALRDFKSEHVIVVDSLSSTGTLLGDLQVGDQLTISYLDGVWTAYTGWPYDSPDETSVMQHRAMLTIQNTAGQENITLPQNTARRAFTHKVTEAGAYSLRIADPQLASNEGQVRFRVKTTLRIQAFQPAVPLTSNPAKTEAPEWYLGKVWRSVSGTNFCLEKEGGGYRSLGDKDRTPLVWSLQPDGLIKATGYANQRGPFSTWYFRLNSPTEASFGPRPSKIDSPLQLQ